MPKRATSPTSAQPCGAVSAGGAFEYDGSFEGLLSAFAEARRQGQATARFAVAGAQTQLPLWGAPFRVAADPVAAADFLRCVREQVSDEAAHRILHLWWAEKPDLADPLFAYLQLGFERGGTVDGYATHPAVRATLQAARRVTGEIHRFKGILRFRELGDGSLYAPMSPDANISLALALHFRERLAAERWAIHDVPRRLAVLWDGHELSTAELRTPPAAPIPSLTTGASRLAGEAPAALAATTYHPREEQVQALWQAFFSAVAIPERRNPELQRRFLPRRYWEYLVERPQAQV
jgi:probable DNA metabolism protein